jgi:predicted small secreted protein
MADLVVRGEPMHLMPRALVLLAAVVTNACSTASGGGPDAGATQTVTGMVLSFEGLPASGDTVIAASGGFTAKGRTDITGRFTILGVPVPYDLYVTAPEGPPVRYVGLTRTDPTVTDLLYRAKPTRTGNLAGQLVGSSYPESPGVATRLLFASPENLYLATYALSNVDYSADGGFASSMQWEGPATTTGALYALQFASRFQENGYLPTQYTGYGSLSSVSLEDMGTVSGQTVTMAPIAAETMAVTVMPPDGYTLYEETAQLSVGPNVPLTIAFLPVTPGTTLTFLAPVIPNTSLVVSANATNDAGAFVEATRTGLAADASVALTFPAPPEPQAPANEATQVGTDITFSWSAYANGVHMLMVIPEKYGAANVVFTAGTSATIQNLNPLPANTGFYWFVVGAAPLASVDDLATSDHYQAFYNGQTHSPFPGLLPHSPGNLTVGVSPQRTFTP